jgi:heme exporter protein CcmB
MNRFFRQTWAILRKDLLIELRTREIIYSAVLFAVVLVTVFLFSGFETAQISRGAAPGVLWVAVAFVGSLVFSRTFQREREERALAAVLLSGPVLDALFVAKLALNFLLLAGVQVVLVPLVMVTFRVAPASWTVLFAVLAVGSLGFCIMGTVLSAALATVRLREVLLPIILYPLCIPLLICGVRATAVLTAGDTNTGDWMAIMIAFNALFLVLGRWLFGEAVDGGD